VKDGFDGTWVAHPDLVSDRKGSLRRKLGEAASEGKTAEEVRVEGPSCKDIKVPGGTISEGGVRNNISVALQYLSAWLGGNGAVAIFT